jgi:hypothetical protein
MPRKRTKLPKFTGPLAKPIESALVWPMHDDELFAEYAKAKFVDLHKLRMQKIPLLAAFLGLPFEFDQNDAAKAVEFYARLATALAILFVPGFREKKYGKMPRPVVRSALIGIEAGKVRGLFNSDLDGCLDFLKNYYEPELARPQNKSRLQRRARTLRNLITRERACLKRAASGKLH